MSASAVLQLRELCDQIAAFLKGSSTDLKSCALVSTSFTASAQSHLFHDIVLNRGCLDIEHIAFLPHDDETVRCTRLCEVLLASPRLVPFVRRLRASFDLVVVTQLSNVKFTNLQELVLHKRAPGVISAESLISTARLLALPSLRKLGLFYPSFADIRDLQQLFGSCSPQMSSLLLHDVHFFTDIQAESPVPATRLLIKTLRILPSRGVDIDWLVTQQCPLSFSELLDADVATAISTSTVLTLLRSARLHLQRLRIDAQFAVNEAYSAETIPSGFDLSQLPAVRTLVIHSLAHELGDVKAILNPVQTTSRIEVLVLELRKSRAIQRAPFASLASTLTSLPSLQRLTVRVLRDTPGGWQSPSTIKTVLKEAFAAFEKRGALTMQIP
ncbi:hypothetical protein C8J57DRAFT_237458 [Mycena rebaudengoi]|nr:hypothetical protein C8J57DRAFT_237458 [Mycena rebaudengoi]